MFLAAVRVLVWLVCLVTALVVLAEYRIQMARAETVFQQTAAAANACVALIATYIITRVVDKGTR